MGRCCLLASLCFSLLKPASVHRSPLHGPAHLPCTRSCFVYETPRTCCTKMCQAAQLTQVPLTWVLACNNDLKMRQDTWEGLPLYSTETWVRLSESEAPVTVCSFEELFHVQHLVALLLLQGWLTVLCRAGWEPSSLICGAVCRGGAGDVIYPGGQSHVGGLSFPLLASGAISATARRRTVFSLNVSWRMQNHLSSLAYRLCPVFSTKTVRVVLFLVCWCPFSF